MEFQKKGYWYDVLNPDHLILIAGSSENTYWSKAVQTFEDVVSKGILAACYQMGEYHDVFAILNNGGGVVKDSLEWESFLNPFIT